MCPEHKPFFLESSSGCPSSYTIVVRFHQFLLPQFDVTILALRSKLVSPAVKVGNDIIVMINYGTPTQIVQRVLAPVYLEVIIPNLLVLIIEAGIVGTET